MQETIKTSINYNIDQLALVPKKIVEFANDQKIWLFYGEMGLGKTTLIRYICKELGSKDQVKSPTFSFVNEYSINEKQSIFHFDFYRLKHEQEAFDFGYEEYFYSNNYCLVEWPSKIASLLPPKNYLNIFLQQADDPLERVLYLEMSKNQ